MNTSEHVSDRLSAYLDGELAHDARAAVDAHLGSCDGCRAVLDALRATLADLSLLPEPEPSAFESQMLRRRLAQERRRPARLVRVAAALGGVAAVLAGIVIVSNEPALDGGGGNARAIAPADDALVVQDLDYSQSEVRGLLTEPAPANLSAENATTGNQYDGAEGPREDRTFDAISRCERVIGTTASYTRLRAIAARYQGQAVYILLYAVDASPARREVWVVTRDACTVRFFAQDEG